NRRDDGWRRDIAAWLPPRTFRGGRLPCLHSKRRMAGAKFDNQPEDFEQALPLGPAEASPRAGAPFAGGLADELLESTAEGGFGIVADLLRHRGDLDAALGQAAGGDLHAPLRQVLDRRAADQLREALGQRRARRAGGGGKVLQRPGAR